MTLKDDVRSAAAVLIRAAIRELTEQGHRATGRGVLSFETRIREDIKGVTANILANDYLAFVDVRTKPHRPPFAAIFEWAKAVRPRLGEAETRSFAWAVVTNMAKVGTPSPGAYSYTENGRRLAWSDRALHDARADIENILEEGFWFERELDNALREGLKNFKNVSLQ